MFKLVLSRTLAGVAVVAGLAVVAVPAEAVAGDDLAADGERSARSGARSGEKAPPIIDEAVDAEIAPPGASEERSGGRAAEERAAPSRAEAPSEGSPQKPEPAPASAKGDLGKLFGSPADKKSAPSPMLEQRGADYYDRRAEELLKKDGRRRAVELHPLMQAHPDSYVVVCTAGCRSSDGPAIVSMHPKPAATPAPAPSDAKGPAVISCLGGCPAGGTGSFVSIPSPAAGGAAVAATVGEWLTTVAQVPAGAGEPKPQSVAGSGAWMKKINSERDSAAKPAAAEAPKVTVEAPKPAPAAPASAAPVKVEAKPDSPPVVATVEPPKVTAVETPKPVPAVPAAAAQVKVEAKAESKPVVAAAEAPKVAAVEAPKPAPVAPAPPVPVKVEAKAESQPVVTTAEAPKSVAPAASAVAAPVSETKPGAETVIAAIEVPKPAVPPAPAVAAPPAETVISVLSEDKEMNAAIEKARGSLATFWSSYDAPAAGETDHALKVAISGNGSTEHFWLTRIKRDGGKLSGLISNQPQSVKTVKMGERYVFTPEMISDWTFKRNGKLVGNETMRVLLPRMPEEQAAVYRQMYERP